MHNRDNLTIDDIATELGVSKTTVSRAISGKGRIGEQTRARILSYIQEHNYRPNAAAKALAENKTYNLAFVTPKSFITLDLPYVRQSMGAAAEEAYSHDYTLLLCLSTDDSSNLLNRILDFRKVDGVILSRTVENDKLVNILTAHNMPFATIGTLPPALKGTAAVEADHDQVGGCRAFSADFLRSGTGPVAILGNDISYIVNQSRLAGFQAAIKDVNFSSEDATIRTGIDNDTKCAQAVDQLLLQGTKRFLAMDDEVCLRILEHLNRRRLQVPADVQLASLCDSDKLATYNISALHFDAAALGRAACRELLAHINGTSYDPAPRLGYRIEMRNSI
ncbi:MAG: LacI family DNA-binding transcriptional regulator [Oscillospiraceae bacterium]|nr:LacI family DNA-binding transcriptional regulator [Oscillospiraceae bacterium]